MATLTWQHFFKPEIRAAGGLFVTKAKVTCSKLSDTEVQCYIRASASFKVILKSPSVASPSVFIDCGCPLSKKGQFCKHIWAALLVTEQKFPDFLDSKSELEKKSQPLVEPYKAKQADYRKAQYQKQKMRMKENKKSKLSPESELQFPVMIEKALKYFLENGFDLRHGFTIESVGLAKKKLSRVFHPDRGGTNDEIQELNKFSDILVQHSKI